jgi:DNA-binding response OmpR family regulator
MKWVLVIDDDPDVCHLLAEGLTQAGFKVVQASQAGEAKAKLAQQQFDCVVTDLYLGRGDGSQLIADLRQGRNHNAKIPVVVMSAHLEVDLVKRLKPMVNTVLVKPFDLKTLIARVIEQAGLPPESEGGTAGDDTSGGAGGNAAGSETGGETPGSGEGDAAA